MKCKCCGEKDAIKYSRYSNGEFCSLKCSKSYSTKEKRKEINRKVKETLTGSGNPKITKECEFCGTEFIVEFRKRKQEFCSVSCASKNRWEDPIYQETISRKLSEINSSGKFHFNSIRCIFNFNEDEIRCDSKKEYNFLEEFCKRFNVQKIERNKEQIPYKYKNRNKIFIPDFKIKFDNKIALCECKTKISKNKTNKEIRENYFLTVPAKRKALKSYCENKNMISIWWDGKIEFMNK